MRDNFYVVLPSNSSASYFPDNTTTHFITRLPQQLLLHGEWGVSLSDIQIPMTFLHLPKTYETNYIISSTRIQKENDKKTDKHIIPHGVYRSVSEVIETVNSIHPMITQHFNFDIEKNGYVSVRRSCVNCMNTAHTFYLSPGLSHILGFEDKMYDVPQNEKKCVALKPASLISALPSVMFIYTDICESYITGDVQTPLLRIVPLDIESYVYGSIKYRSFSTPKYIPLLYNSLQTIEIDIRDEFGKPIPFECGTLTVTLHFKRLD